MIERPLTALSDFVVEQMPNLLATNQQELLSSSTYVLDAISDEMAQDVSMSSCRQLAALDLKMLENALVHSGLEIPSRLTALVDFFSGENSKTLTYEEIVMVNPDEDLRVFSTGNTREIERIFYGNHRLIEEILMGTITRVISVISGQENLPFDCETLANELNKVRRLTAELARMPDGEFLAFRKYLASHPNRKLKGPSGAYSARMPSLELLTLGDSLPAERLHYLRNNWQYFPVRDYPLLMKAMDHAENGNTLQALVFASKSRPDLKEGVAIIEGFFTSFRKVHYYAVKKQVPEVLEGSVAGTGGEVDVHAFLTGRMNK
jgi:hypothetical protein